MQNLMRPRSGSQTARLPTIARVNPISVIKHVVCDLYQITPTELVSISRARRVSWPRQIGMAMAFKFTNHSTTYVAQAFGRNDHTTAIFAQEKVHERRCESAQIEQDLAEVEARIEAVLNDYSKPEFVRHQTAHGTFATTRGAAGRGHA